MRLPRFGEKYISSELNDLARTLALEIDNLTNDTAIQIPVTAVNGDTTPSVRNLKKNALGILKVPATTTYTITSFIDGTDGQHILVINTGTSSITINRANAELDGGTNKTIAVGAAIQLVCLDDVWRQVAAVMVNS